MARHHKRARGSGEMTKIEIPRKKGGKKGGWHAKAKKTYTSEKRKLWLHGRRESSGQQPQSPIRTWAEMSETERAEIERRVKGE